jgi:hypothetical protein
VPHQREENDDGDRNPQQPQKYSFAHFRYPITINLVAGQTKSEDKRSGKERESY